MSKNCSFILFCCCFSRWKRNYRFSQNHIVWHHHKVHMWQVHSTTSTVGQVHASQLQVQSCYWNIPNLSLNLQVQICVLMYTMCPIRRCHYILGHKFVICWSIFTVLSLRGRGWHCLQKKQSKRPSIIVTPANKSTMITIMSTRIYPTNIPSTRSLPASVYQLRQKLLLTHHELRLLVVETATNYVCVWRVRRLVVQCAWQERSWAVQKEDAARVP